MSLYVDDAGASGLRGLGFRVQGLGFAVEGFGFKDVSGLGFRDV